MFAALHLPQFAMQAALRHTPEAWAGPVALVDPARPSPVVLDVTPAAASAGVTPGLTPTQALARCAAVRIVHRMPAAEDATTAAALQVAGAFSPNLEATAPGVVTLDLHGLARLRDADPAAMLAWAGEVRTALAALGLRAVVGLGATPGVARHAARWGQGLELVTDAAAFLAGLPLAALEPSDDVAQQIAGWGLRRVGDLLALGQAELADRLGLEALALFAAASPTATRPLRLVRPPEVYGEAHEFVEPVETVEPLLFLLRRFVDQLCVRLEPAGLVATSLRLRLRLDGGATVERELRLPQPTRRPDVLFRALATHLDGLRTDAPIAAVALDLDPARPAARQFGLFDAALRDPHQLQETLARLAALLGPERVGTPVREAAHRPEAFRLVPPGFDGLPPVIRPAARFRLPPLRRLRPAAPAVVEDRTGPGGEPVPAALRSALAAGRLAVTGGPWRAAGRWWEPGGWRRETWDVATPRGEGLRLVRQP
ncbi:MAG: Y-family DNA polymerase, partial [Limisphaerales bacterium]